MDDLYLLAGSVVLALGIGLGVHATRRILVQRNESKRIRDIFSRYFPPSVVEDLLARRDADIFRGRSGRATILTCRIWNFPALLEGRTPADALKYLNEFYYVVGSSVQKYGGMIDKFLGDGVTAVFGMPPLEEEGQEEMALRTAIDIVRLVNSMDARWKADKRQPLHVGIGINSGTVIVGDIGFKDRREFTTIGPEVQIAARLQEHTEELNAYIIASKSTMEPVREKFDVLPFENIPLRGMRKLHEVFVVRGVLAGEEELSGPSPDEFAQTAVTEAERKKKATPPPPKEAAPKTEKPGPGAKMPPPPRVARARNAAKVPPNIDVPELRYPRVRKVDDVKPEMPEAPKPAPVYEDKGGPPIALPP